MNRRGFLEQTTLAAAGFFTGSRTRFPHPKHLVLIVNAGARKKDYYEDESLSPNIRRLAGGGFVFEEDHCDRIASHTLLLPKWSTASKGPIHSLSPCVAFQPSCSEICHA